MCSSLFAKESYFCRAFSQEGPTNLGRQISSNLWCIAMISGKPTCVVLFLQKSLICVGLFDKKDLLQGGKDS